MKRIDQYWAGRRVIDNFDEAWIANPLTGCHEWIRSMHPSGYGQVRVCGRPEPAHRVSWRRAKGDIPNGLHVLHSCDNRKCVNPDHLRLGTNLENVRDKQARGRAHRHSSGIYRSRTSRRTVRRSFDDQYVVDQLSGCWLWTRALLGGYGQLLVDGRKIRAHRYAYERVFGPIPVGIVVRHRCDVPHCVNPDHLVLGTQSDNIADMVMRGRARGAVGVRNSHAKLTPSKVAEIRTRSARGESRVSLAREFGVAATMVSNIALGLNWRSVEVTP